jgi:hypothetical protein
MKIRLYFLLVLISSCMATLAQEIRSPEWITNGVVNAMSSNSTHTFWGGYFDQIGRKSENGIAFDLATGEPIFSGDQPDRVVSSSASDGQGGFFIGGTTSNTNLGFTKVGDVSREELAHILPNGQVSMIFNPILANGRKARKMVLASSHHRVIVATQSYTVWHLMGASSGSVRLPAVIFLQGWSQMAFSMFQEDLHRSKDSPGNVLRPLMSQQDNCCLGIQERSFRQSE